MNISTKSCLQQFKDHIVPILAELCNILFFVALCFLNFCIYCGESQQNLCNIEFFLCYDYCLFCL